MRVFPLDYIQHGPEREYKIDLLKYSCGGKKKFQGKRLSKTSSTWLNLVCKTHRMSWMTFAALSA